MDEAVWDLVAGIVGGELSLKVPNSGLWQVQLGAD